MKCDIKTMLKAGILLAALVTGAYLVFPGAREWLIGMSPFLLLLLCPLMIIFIIMGIRSCHADTHNKDEKRSVNDDKTF